MFSICTYRTLLIFFSVQTLSLAAVECPYPKRSDGTCCKPIACGKDMQYRLCTAKLPAVGNDFCEHCPEGKFNPDAIVTNFSSISEIDVCIVPDCECPPETVLVNGTSCQRTGTRVCECDVEQGYWGMDPHLCTKIVNVTKWKIIQRPGYELTLSGDVEPCKRGMFKSKGDNSSCKPHTRCKADERVEFKGNTTSDTVCVKKPTPRTEESTTKSSPTIESTSPTPPSGVNNMTTETYYDYVVKIAVLCIILVLLTLTVLIILFCVYLKWKKYIASHGHSIGYCTYLMACLRYRSFNHTDRYRRVNGIPQTNGIQVDVLRGNDSLGGQTGESLMLQNENPSNHRSNGQAPRGNPQRNESANGHIRGSDVGTPDTQRNENGHMSPMDPQSGSDSHMDLPHSGSDSRMDLPHSGRDSPMDLPQSGSNSCMDLPHSGRDSSMDLPQSGSNSCMDLPHSGRDSPMDLPQSGSNSCMDLPHSGRDSSMDLPQLASDSCMDLPHSGRDSPMDLPQLASDSCMDVPQSGNDSLVLPSADTLDFDELLSGKTFGPVVRGNQRQQSCGQTKSAQSEELGACYRGALNSGGNEDLKEDTELKHLDLDIIPSENPAKGTRRNSVQGSDDSQCDPAHLGESRHYNSDSVSNPTQASIDKLDVKSILSGEDDNTAIKKPGKARRPVARVRPMEQKKSQQTREDSHITQPTENREETCARPVPYINGRFVEPFYLNAQSQAASEPSVTTAPEPSSGDHEETNSDDQESGPSSGDHGTNSDDQESGPSSGDHGNNSDHQAPELPSGDLANNSDHQSLENISFNDSDLASLHELSDEDEQQY